MEILIDTAKETAEGIRDAIRMLQALVGPDHSQEKAPRRGAGAVEEATAGLSEAVARLPETPPPPPPPQSMTSAVPVAATNTTSATEDASSAGTIPRADSMIDSAGVAWNNKLHTSTKTKDIDGKWKPRKSREAPVPLPTSVVPPVTTVPTPPPPPIPASFTPLPTPPPPLVMVPSAGDDEADADIEPDMAGGVGLVPKGPQEGIKFADFIVQVTTAANNGALSQARIAEVQKQFGLVSLFSLQEGEASKLQDVARAFGFAS